MSRTHVIAGYFMWRDAGPAWERDMRRFPLLGGTDDTGQHLGYQQDDPAAIERHLIWAQAHGVRVLAPIWRGRYDGGWDAAMSAKTDVFRAVIAQSRFSNMSWCLLLGNVVPDNSPPDLLDFGPPGAPTAVYENFVASLTTGLAERGWLADRRYFTIDDKPVVVIFRSKDYSGDYRRAVEEVRAFHDGRAFLIGMSGLWHRFFDELDEAALDRVRAFDAVTAWSATAGSPGGQPDLAAVADFLAPRLATWRDGASLLGRLDDPAVRVGFVPSITCQYDKAKLTGNDRTTRYARDREDLRRLVRLAADSFDPFGIGANRDRLVWVQTFNEWPEGTACEPTELGEGYPYADPEYQDHYGFEFLEVLREELQPALKRTPREAIPIVPAPGARLTTTTPTFRWDEVRANPGVDLYRLRVWQVNGPVVFNDNVGNVTDFTLPWGLLERGRSYSWRLRVHNRWARGWSEWTEPRSFDVV